MTRNRTTMLVASGLTALGLLASGMTARASSHREAPSIGTDQVADNTDLYAWVTPGSHDKLNIIASWIPLEEPSAGPNFYKFSDDVRYEIHIARGNQSLNDKLTYYIQFKTKKTPRQEVTDKMIGGGKEFFAQLTNYFSQTYTVTKVDANGGSTVIAKDVAVAPPRIGPRTFMIAQKAKGSAATEYDDAFAATFIKDMGKEGRVFAGPRDDGFYVDLGGIFDLANLRGAGAKDGLAGFNVHSIALEIPINKVTGTNKGPRHDGTAGDDTTIGIWAASSRRASMATGGDGNGNGNGGSDGDGDNDGDEADASTRSAASSGGWVQVSRIGLPLINEAVIGLQDKDKYNRTTPKNDVKNFGAYFLNPVIVRDAEAVGIYDLLKLPADDYKTDRLDIIDAINLTNYPTKGAHHIPLSATGDVLRVDLALDSAFPNGRPLVGGTDREQADVTDVLLSVLLTKGAVPVTDGVNANDKQFLDAFPYLALPWEGFAEGHGDKIGASPAPSPAPTAAP